MSLHNMATRSVCQINPQLIPALKLGSWARPLPLVAGPLPGAGGQVWPMQLPHGRQEEKLLWPHGRHSPDSCVRSIPRPGSGLRRFYLEWSCGWTPMTTVERHSGVWSSSNSNSRNQGKVEPRRRGQIEARLGAMRTRLRKHVRADEPVCMVSLSRSCRAVCRALGEAWLS